MTIKDIIFLKSVTPIAREKNPSPKTIEFATRFIHDFQASNFLVNTRKQFGLLETGVDIRPFIGKNLLDPITSDGDSFYGAIQLIASSLRGKMGLDDSVVDQMVLLIFFNACIDFRYFSGSITQPIRFVVGKGNIAKAAADNPQEIAAILVPFTTSQNGIVNWIKENWKNIDTQINDNLTSDPFLLKVHKNTVLASEIIDLKDNKNMTFSSIATHLTDTYPENLFVTSEEWVKKTYYDFKRVLKQPLPKLSTS